MAKSTCKREFHPYAVFSARAQRKVKPSDKLALSSINRDQLKDSHNYLNQKMIASINTVVDSTLGDNLVMSHTGDYMSPALIPSEAVEND